MHFPSSCPSYCFLRTLDIDQKEASGRELLKSNFSIWVDFLEGRTVCGFTGCFVAWPSSDWLTNVLEVPWLSSDLTVLGPILSSLTSHSLFYVYMKNACDSKKIVHGLLPRMAAFLYFNAMTGPCAMLICKDGPVAVNEVVVQNAQRCSPSCVEIQLRV